MSKAFETLCKYTNEFEVEVSEMSVEEYNNMICEMRNAGFKFNRTEPRYESCVMAIFELY